MRIFLLGLLVTGCAMAQGLWKGSAVALAGAGTADVVSSWGKRELNPGLAGADGRFGAKGALIKAGVVAGILGVEALVLRRRPKWGKGLALLNFASAGVTGAVAVRNFGVPR